MTESRFLYVTYIRTSPERLWQALIDPEFTRQYWSETVQESEWKTGASWRLMIPDGRVADSGEVVEFDSPRKLVLKWRNELQMEMREEGYSQLSHEIEQMDGMVKLTTIHSMPKSDSKFIDAVSGGWPMILASLKSLLETGESLEATRKWPEGRVNGPGQRTG
ncbi:MAG: SRPBCC family protein [Gemmatimonas sp.]